MLANADKPNYFPLQQREMEYEDSVAKEDQPVVSNICLHIPMFLLPSQAVEFPGSLKMRFSS